MGTTKHTQSFPSRLLNQKDAHSHIFNQMAHTLFKGTTFPIVHWPSKKPVGVRNVEMTGQDRQVRVMTFKGVTVYGIPSFPSESFEDFAWVPKPLLADYFEEEYLGETAWAITHGM